MELMIILFSLRDFSYVLVPSQALMSLPSVKGIFFVLLCPRITLEGVCDITEIENICGVRVTTPHGWFDQKSITLAKSYFGVAPNS